MPTNHSETVTGSSTKAGSRIGTMILALDLGTTYFKAALFDPQGMIAALSRRPLNVSHPEPGRWELGVDEFEGLIRGLISDLSEQSVNGLSDVGAVSFATQANSFVLLDCADQPLTPFVLWPDDRAVRLKGEISQLAAELPLQATTGIPALGHQFLVAKLLWFQQHQPETWSGCRRLCLLSDYLTYWMTGQHATEAGVAGLSGLVDIHALRWWPEACERIALPSGWLPRVVRAGTDLGPLRVDAAQSLGLPAACRFVVGCLDQYAGAIGAGNVTPGGVSETTGTVLATVRCSDTFERLKTGNVFHGPGFAEGIYYQMVFGNTSANLLEAYRNQLPDRPGFEELDQAASEISPGADQLRLRPDAAPSDPGSFFTGMTPSHQRGHAVRAIMEGVTLALAEQVDQLCGNDRPSEIRSVGGAARSRLWRQIKASALGCPVVATDCPEPTSLGAALLAASAMEGIALDAICSRWVDTARS